MTSELQQENEKLRARVAHLRSKLPKPNPKPGQYGTWMTIHECARLLGTTADEAKEMLRDTRQHNDQNGILVIDKSDFDKVIAARAAGRDPADATGWLGGRQT